MEKDALWGSKGRDESLKTTHCVHNDADVRYFFHLPQALRISILLLFARNNVFTLCDSDGLLAARKKGELYDNSS